MAAETTFWADQTASDIEANRDQFVVATGITPSGEIHIGNMREVVTADAIVRALGDRKKKVSFIYIADTYDPLRRVYPFLNQQQFAPHVGKPLCDIPCPCGDHESYSEHFLEPFLHSLNALDINVEVVRADQMYREGKFDDLIVTALKASDRIKKILKELTGKETADDWSPFNPICGACGRISEAKVIGFSAEEKTVLYRCGCGDEGVAPMAGGGKLTWRVDWAARWKALGVTIEPFGKDHASRGGSYDTGERFSREIFGYEPPFPVVYEWISLRGTGDMSSSKGNVISIAEMIEVIPPEVLKYSVIKQRPNRSMTFDPGLPLLTLMDEFDDPTSSNRNGRAAELATVPGSPPIGVPFRHLISLLQTSRGDLEKISEGLKRTGYPEPDQEALKVRIGYAENWLKKFGPEEIRFSLQDALPDQVKDLTESQGKALSYLASRFKPDLKPEEIHALVYEAKDACEISPKELFKAIYISLLGKTQGPRAGFFLATLDPEFVRVRFEEAAGCLTSSS